MVFNVNLFCIVILSSSILQYSSDAVFLNCYSCLNGCKDHKETPQPCFARSDYCSNHYDPENGSIIKKECLTDEVNQPYDCHEHFTQGKKYIRCICSWEYCNAGNWQIEPRGNSSALKWQGKPISDPQVPLHSSRPTKKPTPTVKKTTTTIRSVPKSSVTSTSPYTTTEDPTHRYRSSSEESTTHSSIVAEDHLTKYSTTPYTRITSEPEHLALSPYFTDTTRQPENVEEETEQNGELIVKSTKLPDFQFTTSPVISTKNTNTEEAVSQSFTPTDEYARGTYSELTTETATTSTTGTQKFDLFSSSSRPTPTVSTEEHAVLNTGKVTTLTTVEFTTITTLAAESSDNFNFPPTSFNIDTIEQQPKFINVTASAGDAMQNSSVLITVGASVSITVVIIAVGICVYVIRKRKRKNVYNLQTIGIHNESFEMT